MDLFPGTKLGIGPAIDDGFYYDFDLPRPLTPDDLAAIEARMRECVAADHPFVLQRAVAGRGRAFLVERDQPYKVEILDDLRPAPSASAAPVPPTTFTSRARSSTCATVRTSRAPARSVRSSCSAGRRLLARRREAADAPAHLRHGLGDPGRARPVPVAAGGGEEARPPPARRAARPVQLPRRLARVGLLASRRAGVWRDARGRHARAPGATRLPGDQHADPRPTRSCGSSRATGTCTATTCSSLESEDQTFSLKPMNCPESTFIYRSKVRSYRDLPLRLPSTAAPSQRAVGHARRA